jgi:hypothetical protein
MGGSPHAEAIAELYALPLEEFTGARDALAKRLRADGDRDGASEVKALRKAAVTAWAVNRVRSRDPERVDELIEAGARLRDAQEQMGGSGGRSALRDAITRERELVEALVESAAAELEASGHAATAATRSRVFATLHAAVGDEEARALLAAGRLVRDYELSGLGLGFGVTEAEAPTAVAAPPSKPAEPSVSSAATAQRERDIAAARERVEQAVGARVETGEQLAAAEREAAVAATELADAEALLRDAALAVERAQSARSDAMERLDSARARHDQADEEVAERERALASSLSSDAETAESGCTRPAGAG